MRRVPRVGRNGSVTLALYLLALLPCPVLGQGLFGPLLALFVGPCRDSVAPRCGFRNLGYQVRTGLDGTEECSERCVYLPALSSGNNLVCDGSVCGPVTTTPSSFDVTLDMEGIPFLDRSRFSTATARWESIITSNLTDIVTADYPAFTTVPPTYKSCAYPERIDDLYICAAYVKRDGVGNVLGFATVGFIRDPDGFPVTGTMSFDSDDVPAMKANGDFDPVLLHEIGHLLGLGTRWEGQGVAGSRDVGCPYLGARATAEYQTISGCQTLPTEQDGGGGTVCSHFDEACLQRELMTGAINTGVKNLLSRITIASLEDLGYDVNYNGADAFGRSQLNPGCSCRGSRALRRHTGEDESSRWIANAKVSSVQSQRPKRRRLSDEMRLYAIEQGQLYLQRQPSLPRSFPTNWNESELRYVGDQYVSVIVRDTDGEIFDVDVYRDD